MAVRCPECNEELLGAVNRCWRCGRQFAMRLDASGLPPIRRSPLPSVLAPALEVGAAALQAGAPAFQAGETAVLAGSPPADLGNSAASGNGAAPSKAEPAEGAQGPVVRRTGSPFLEPGTRNTPTDTTQATGNAPERSGAIRERFGQGPGGASFQPDYPTGTAAIGGAIGALVLGIFSLLACSFTSAALITGLLGLSMGVWGLYSPRRRMAAVGIVICILALGVSGFQGAVALYTYMEGASPFATESELLDPDGELLP